MNDLAIDAFEFCRVRERREGEIAIRDLSRLAEESLDSAGALRWMLQGGSNKQGHPQMNLTVAGSVHVLCQRCLTPVEIDIGSSSVLVLAPDEGSADEIDALLDDDAVEVIVGSHEFDVGQLIEDEALLAIPSSPKHEACPVAPPALKPEPEMEKESPFAVLKNLKK